jgi:hypothetical protein
MRTWQHSSKYKQINSEGCKLMDEGGVRVKPIRIPARSPEQLDADPTEPWRRAPKAEQRKT